ncbi:MULTISPECIES: hypothetical protein [Sphingobium]|jgi:hypothetical protein|uniref:Uncharacterized protein n=1 Tax=Sphingobium fuliginis (strain ATCC 27551) TaxID=336203 RepID=A0A292ZLR8_SPHSA|nr:MULTISPECIES: hypothetical protein [Sphingobium]PNP97276.1 hypothetical protein A8G00_22320 [Sphingobium sp. SA916]QOT73685.1 hypothetical protein H5V43_21030 [Sphingobium fuliginis]UXC93150.1 hypothetical protein EGM87_22915 [Sphingobium sp. RSMS]GAY23823.1 hypothetical protein SFOMI_4401 [Sphingobium fuliginis]
MSEYIPSTQLRAGSSTTAADFNAGVDSTLSIESLVTRFSQALGLQAASHACYAVGDGERRFLFGETGWCGPIAQPEVLPQICFPITGWDERQYEVEIRLLSMLESPEERANLHAMATLYLCRGIALLDARDDLAASALTETELFCLDQRQAGWCDLDIAEALDRSVQAVKVHVQRARQKQAA